MKKLFRFWAGWLLLATMACSPQTGPENAAPEKAEELTELPMQRLDLSPLPGQNPGWTEAAGFAYDLLGAAQVQTEDGSGILLSQGAEDGTASLLNTGIEHQDLDLNLEFMLPSGGTVKLPFQGKYEVTLNDSWNKNVPFCGSIASEAPPVNAVKAPGLWQQFSASFHAPDFDEAGNKSENAYLSEVQLNGMPIFSKIELSETEASQNGPLQISATPNAAVRHLEYKKYGDDALRLENIRYEVFFGDWDQLPDFDDLEVAETGEADFIDVGVAGQADKYALKFYGDLTVPADGDYFIQSTIDDGGDIFVDGNLVLHNDGEPNIGTEQTITPLKAGTHDFEMTYFQDHWGAVALIMYEGPEIAMQPLAADPRAAQWLEREPPTLQLTDLEETQLLRCFAHYEGEKRTHVIAVGSPDDIHYLYDLDEMALLKGWRGDFADVAEMWINRGERQLMKPQNAAIELTDKLPVATPRFQEAAWPGEIPDDFNFKRIGYSLNDEGLPIFQYQLGETTFSDYPSPASDGIGLIRTLEREGRGSYVVRLAQGEQIRQSESGLYAVDGQYYIEILEGEEVVSPS
jgi:hypothetical protein